MPDYKNAKIYRIVCNVTGLTYVGSTCQTLAQRLCNHRARYKHSLANPKVTSCTSTGIIAGGNYDIVLVEKCPCECKDELLRRERHYIETLECVNKQIPSRTKTEYRIANKETIAKKKKEDYLKNVDSILEYQNKYRAANKEKIDKRNKKYYKEKLAQKNATKVHCGCGSVHSHGFTLGHLKTNTHKKWVESQAWLTATCAES